MADYDIEKVYYSFPHYHRLKGRTDVPDQNYLDLELENCLAAFLEIEPGIAPIAHVVQQGESPLVDECRIDFLFTYHDGLFSNLMNDATLVFMVTTPPQQEGFVSGRSGS